MRDIVMVENPPNDTFDLEFVRLQKLIRAVKSMNDEVKFFRNPFIKKLLDDLPEDAKIFVFDSTSDCFINTLTNVPNNIIIQHCKTIEHMCLEKGINLLYIVLIAKSYEFMKGGELME